MQKRSFLKHSKITTIQKIAIDKSGSNISALNYTHDILPEDQQTEIRQKNKYLNNVVEQDHGFIKKASQAYVGL
ncbi:hypothetical protein phytr_12600 [Candidatus Phycorickettsia trachydisci]|uniref:Uncharacterized protein n=1 Tax=Candidatus Phycorickettsia trachydisci TaxID=2115978 RepID=A0A2P1PA79_9RICK|nr:hypothetical protein phytr_12600 [Candidatus Phycorickettsia trachydisci]